MKNQGKWLQASDRYLLFHCGLRWSRKVRKRDVLGLSLLATVLFSAGVCGRKSVELIGVPVHLVSTIGITVATDASGEHERIFCSFHNGRPPMFIAEIDPETGEVWKHYSPADSEQGAWAITTGPDGNVYVGTYYRGHLLRFDLKRRVFEDLGRPGDEQYFWTFSVAPDGKIYGGTYPSGKLIAFDPAVGAAEDLGRMWDDEMYVRTTAVDSAGRIYCGMGSTSSAVVAFNPVTGEKENLTPANLRGPGFAQVTNDEWGGVIAKIADYYFRVVSDSLQPIDSAEWRPRVPRLGNGLVVRSTEPSRVDLVDSRSDSIVRSFHVEGDGSVIFSLAAGPDGRLYGSTLLPLRMFAYDPTTKSFEDLRNPTTVGGEIYSFASLHNRMYLGAYPHADFTVYDPSGPWKRGVEPGSNPRNWGKIGHEQDRPIAMVVGPDRRIYVGSIPEYGHLGGALAVFDPATNQMKVFRNLVPDQSILALAVDSVSARIFGGSGIHGGPGSHPVAKEAEVFVWDVREQKVVGRAVSVAGARAVRAIAVSQNRLVGVADTTLFTMDLRTLRTVRAVPFGILPSHKPELARGLDNNLYAFNGPTLCRIDPVELRVEKLVTYSGRIGAGPVLLGDYLYFSAGEKLLRFRLQ